MKVIRVRGKNKIWNRNIVATFFIASFVLSMMLVPHVFAENTISVTPYESGPKNPGDTFSVDLVVDEAYGVRAYEFVLSWNQRTLALDEGNPIDEGPFLSSGGSTFFVYSIGVAGESITVANLITTYDYADAFDPTVVVTVNFKVVGGGDTDIDLDGVLNDVDFNTIDSTWVGGHFWSPFPRVEWTWLVPTRTSPTIEYVEGGPMYWDDEIRFDASASSDYDGTIETVEWRVEHGGVAPDFTGRGITVPTVDEFSGVVADVVFPWDDVGMGDGKYYNWFFLGWAKLIVTATDNDGNSAELSSWIHIFPHGGMGLGWLTAIFPTGVIPKNINIEHRGSYSIAKFGDEITMRSTLKNTMGTGLGTGMLGVMWEYVLLWIELGRAITERTWAKAYFVIRDASTMAVVGEATGDASYIAGEEECNSTATWTAPGPGNYLVFVYPLSSGSGYVFNTQGIIPKVKSLTVVP